jgi:hypothetical protein
MGTGDKGEGEMREEAFGGGAALGDFLRFIRDWDWVCSFY